MIPPSPALHDVHFHRFSPFASSSNTNMNLDHTLHHCLTIHQTILLSPSASQSKPDTGIVNQKTI
eukprot:767771-Hanusia_phi.AAC.5